MGMLIGDAMTRSVETISKGATLREAARQMASACVGFLVVLEGNQPVGVVTDRDITVRGVAKGLDPNATPVEQAMTFQAITCHEDQPIAAAARIMEEKAVRRLIVLDTREQLAGVISLDDLATIPGEDEKVSRILERLPQAGL
jgi:CBS domain-containing protein